jgi:phosphoribosylformimino-5-aminoimidazole carboxamide ribotide isomerase
MPLDIFPAVDILEGQCVQLVQGQREKATRFGEPLRCAHRWLAEGAESLHIINLDGAFGDAARNIELIRLLIRETGVTIQLGGGIRSLDDAVAWLELGVQRIILGTLAIRDPAVIRILSEEFGPDRVMAGVDARSGQIVVEGWRESAGDYLEWAKRFEDLGAGSLLYTNVNVEGLQAGIDREPVMRLLEQISLPVVVAGGISTVGDIIVLRDLGAAGVVLGSALYSGKIRLKDALQVRG